MEETVKHIDTGVTHEPGLYFGMPDEEYHAIPALSASGIKNILVSPMDFWARSWMNPKHEFKTSVSMEMGTAYHTRILEGKGVFDTTYAPEFNPNDYPNALETTDDLKGYIKLLKSTDKKIKITGKKSDLISRIREHDEVIEIIDELKAEYEELHKGLSFLSDDLIESIEYAAAMIEKHPDLSKCFAGGYPEVTVIWIDAQTGVFMKSRFDYLKLKAIVDLKTYNNALQKPIDRAIYNSMASCKYHIQAATYMEADKQAVKHAQASLVFGDVDNSWVESYAKVEERPFIFVFQQTGIVPLARGKIFPKNGIHGAGEVSMREGIDLFAECIKTFGTDPWIDTAPIENLEDEGFPIWTTET